MSDTTRRLGKLALPVLAAALLLPSLQPAHAETQRPENLTRLIADSTAIVEGTVQTVSDGIDERGIPYTEVTLLVRSSARGAIADRSEYTFRQYGLLEPRRMDDGRIFLGVSPAEFPRWHEGESVVAFLHRPASRTGLQTTAGLAQGKLTLRADGLSNRYGNRGLFAGVEIDDALLRPEERVLLTTPGAVDAGTFMNLVQRAVSGNWIENGEMR